MKTQKNNNNKKNPQKVLYSWGIDDHFSKLYTKCRNPKG